MPRMMTIAQLKRAIAAQERRVAGLVAQRAEFARRLAAVDREIVAMGGEVPKAGKRPGRKPAKAAPQRRTRKLPKNTKPLIEYIKDVLAGSKAGMRVNAVQAAVLKAGYQTTSKQFYGTVAAALREGPFKKVSRGVYTLKVAKQAPKRAAGKGAAKDAAAK